MNGTSILCYAGAMTMLHHWDKKEKNWDKENYHKTIGKATKNQIHLL